MASFVLGLNAEHRPLATTRKQAKSRGFLHLVTEKLGLRGFAK